MTMNNSYPRKSTKSEARISKSETNVKYELPNVQNNRLWAWFLISVLRAFRFGHLNFWNLKIVLDFDIRVSDLSLLVYLSIIDPFNFSSL